MADDFINVVPETDAGERYCLNETRIQCVGSKCMAWRWQPLMADEAFKIAVKERMNTAEENHTKAASYVVENRAEFGLHTEPYLGYCGLAGKP